MQARQFLQTVTNIHELRVLSACCRESVRAVRKMLLLNGICVKAKNKHEVLDLIDERIRGECEFLCELAPAAVQVLGEHPVDHALDVLYGCWVACSKAAASAYTAVAVEAIKRVLAYYFNGGEGIWWSDRGAIALDHTTDMITITFTTSDDKHVKHTWRLQTPCNAATMRRWIAQIIEAVIWSKAVICEG